jgi:hypothetical protein
MGRGLVEMLLYVIGRAVSGLNPTNPIMAANENRRGQVGRSAPLQNPLQDSSIAKQELPNI